jgi:hypothetical protein
MKPGFVGSTILAIASLVSVARGHPFSVDESGQRGGRKESAAPKEVRLPEVAQ